MRSYRVGSVCPEPQHRHKVQSLFFISTEEMPTLIRCVLPPEREPYFPKLLFFYDSTANIAACWSINNKIHVVYSIYLIQLVPQGWAPPTNERPFTERERALQPQQDIFTFRTAIFPVSCTLKNIISTRKNSTIDSVVNNLSMILFCISVIFEHMQQYLHYIKNDQDIVAKLLFYIKGFLCHFELNLTFYNYESTIQQSIYELFHNQQ